MQSRNQYLKVLRESYLKAKAKKEKTQILDEYCRNTGQARKYVIRKIQPGVDLRPKQRKKRKQTYDGQVTAALAKVWEIFDCPCGQRPKPVLEVELDRLMDLGELRVSDEVALKLKIWNNIATWESLCSQWQAAGRVFPQLVNTINNNGGMNPRMRWGRI